MPFFFNPQLGSLLLLYLFAVVYIANQMHLASVQSLSHVRLFATPRTAARQGHFTFLQLTELLPEDLHFFFLTSIDIFLI